MLAREPVYLRFRQGVIDELAKQKGEVEPLEVGWILEGWACRAALEAHARGEARPEFGSAVVRRAGEVGRHLGLLADTASKSNSLDEFQGLLLAENFTFLLDAEPASRVWAYDWLKEQGRAPPGYDPLGTSEERRQALLQAIQEAEQKQ